MCGCFGALLFTVIYIYLFCVFIKRIDDCVIVSKNMKDYKSVVLVVFFLWDITLNLMFFSSSDTALNTFVLKVFKYFLKSIYNCI